MIQKPSDKFWSDENGTAIPYNRVTPHERAAEKQAGILLKKALSINGSLVKFRAEIQEVCTKLRDDFMAARRVEAAGKGNFTWYNFDRSIKIEVSINDRIEFDDLLITACKTKLNGFIDQNIDSKLDFVKDMVNDAFSTSRGKLDAKKVMGLLKYKSKINSPEFHEALDLLEEAIRRPDSKTYFRVWQRTDNGKYESVELNFSNI